MHGAVVTWTPLPESVGGAGSTWHAIDWRALEEQSLRTTSDADGVFAFVSEALPPSPHGSVVWVTHADFRAAHRILAADTADIADAARATLGSLTLEGAEPRAATVVAAGQGVDGATVLQFAVAEDGTGKDEIRARQVFFREWRTGSQGTARLATLSGREGLVASHEGLQSQPVTRPSSEDVVLELLPSFQAEGTILLSDGAEMPEDVQVHCDLRDGEEWQRQVSSAVRRDASWGPVSIARGEAASFRFSVEGGGVVRAAVELAAPPAGETLQVDLETILGLDQWFVAADAESGDPLAEARLEVHWQEESGAWTIIEVRPREDGYIFARGCRPGTIYYIARCPGYAFSRGGPQVIPTAEPYTFELTMHRAGRVEGVCTFEGLPVRDFQVLYWPRNLPNQLWRETYTEREDGTFAVDEVAAGDLTVIAHAEGYGQSEAVRVEVPVGGSARVELPLSVGRTGRGVIVDQISGEPIEGAEVQLYATHGSRPMYGRGDPIATDSEGRFEVDGFSDVPSTLVIAAAGYSPRQVTSQASGPSSIDLGRIELAPTQPLEVRLHYPAGADPTQYWARTESAGLPPTRFSADGVVLVEEFTAGAHTFAIDLPDLDQFFNLIDLVPGKAWVVEVPLDGPCRLDLRALPAEGHDLPESLWGIVKSPPQRGVYEWWSFSPRSGRMLFEHLPSGVAHVELFDRDHIVASRRVELEPGVELLLELTVGDDLHRLRVVDDEGRPLAATEVSFSVDGNEDARLGGTTNARGEIECAGLGRGELTANLMHRVAGMAKGVPVRLSADPDEVVELVLVAGGAWSAILLDGDLPLPGILCRLNAGVTVHPLGASLTSDAAGRVEWDKVGSGEFDFLADHPGYWPVRASLSATKKEPHRIQMRRRGDLVCRVVDAEAAALAGVGVRLESLEFGVDVATWIEEGLVQASSAQLVTDGQGELEVSGLPHGDYRWQVQLAGAEPFGGTATVPRGARAVEVLRAP